MRLRHNKKENIMTKKKTKLTKENFPLEAMENENSSPFDVNGSYTGKCFFNEDSTPVQDADDL